MKKWIVTASIIIGAIVFSAAAVVVTFIVLEDKEQPKES